MADRYDIDSDFLVLHHLVAEDGRLLPDDKQAAQEESAARKAAAVKAKEEEMLANDPVKYRELGCKYIRNV